MRGTLVQGSDGADDADADAERYGLSPEIRAALAGRSHADTAVWQQNAGAVMAFLRVGTQWRVVSGPGGSLPIGLDYAGVRVALHEIGMTITPDLWGDLQVMEHAALAAFGGDRA